jgi:hypothetical protein
MSTLQDKIHASFSTILLLGMKWPSAFVNISWTLFVIWVGLALDSPHSQRLPSKRIMADLGSSVGSVLTPLNSHGDSAVKNFQVRSRYPFQFEWMLLRPRASGRRVPGLLYGSVEENLSLVNKKERIPICPIIQINPRTLWKRHCHTQPTGLTLKKAWMRKQY